MRLGIAIVSSLLAAIPAPPAHAQNRSFCTDRIDADTQVCALRAGDAIVEVTTLAYDRSSVPINVNDTLVLADMLLRFGLDDVTEFQLGFAGLVHAVTRERVGAYRDSAIGIGDGYVALRRALPGFGAVEAFVTLPTGRGAAGAGTWGAGLALPIDLPSPPGLQFYAVPQVEALPDASGAGRHLNYGGALGMARDIGRDLVGTLELYAFHDLDPAGRGFNGRVAGSLAWHLSPDVQLNAEANVGVAHDAPRGTLLFGIALRL